ncbi:MAG: hypothetical protein AAGK78_08810 [Planctomycetota bacterium]
MSAPHPQQSNTYTAELRRSQAVMDFERRGEVTKRAKTSASEAAFASLMRKPEPAAPVDTPDLQQIAAERRRRKRVASWIIVLLVVVAVQVVLLQVWGRLLSS